MDMEDAVNQIQANIAEISQLLQSVVGRLAVVENAVIQGNQAAAVAPANNPAQAYAEIQGVHQVKAMKPLVKDFIESDMGAFFTRYTNWLRPLGHPMRTEKYLLFCEVANGQRLRNVDHMSLESRDDAISYEQFEENMRVIFCPPNASLIARRAYKNYKQSGTEPAISYVQEKMARWERAYPANGAGGRDERELITNLSSGLYHAGLKKNMINLSYALTKDNYTLKLGDQLTICHQLHEEGLAEDTSLLGLYITHSQVPHLEINGTDPQAMEVNRLDSYQAGPRKCHGCGSTKHLLRACPTKTGGRDSGRHRGQPAGKAGAKAYCHKCHGTTHSTTECYIPTDKLPNTIKRNDAKRTQGGANRQPRGVHVLETEQDVADEEDTEGMLVSMLQTANIATLAAGFRQGSF